LDGEGGQLARDGYAAWQAGHLDDACTALSELRRRGAGDQDSTFHALQLLACVAFTRGDLPEARDLHEQVLSMADAIHFLGGIGSSQFDLAMVEQADGNLATAAARYGAARDAFERGGGYTDRIAIVERGARSVARSREASDLTLDPRVTRGRMLWS
jgi:hypothetical protein